MSATVAPSLILVIVLPFGLMAFASGVCLLLYRAWSRRD
jgi:hypothetical protein